jgi:hypothetical protein
MPLESLASYRSLTIQNPLLAASNALGAPRSQNGDDDKLSDYVPDSRDMSVSRAVSRCFASCRTSSSMYIVHVVDSDGAVENHDVKDIHADSQPSVAPSRPTRPSR